MKNPLAAIKDKFENKAKLVSELEKITKDEDLWVSRLNSNKGLAHVSNAKLLKLHATFAAVKDKFGTRAKMIDAIAEIEKRIKQFKDTLKQEQSELELKLRLKRIGGDEAKAETSELRQQVETQLKVLNPNHKDDKKQITALHKDKAALELRLSRIDGVLAAIGGRMTDAEAKTLILKKLYDWVKEQLTRYLNAEKRTLIARVENLWDKYAVSSRELETDREKTLKTLDTFLSKLGYLG